MKFRKSLQYWGLGIAAMVVSLSSYTEAGERKLSKRPNILWIILEDTSPFLGCYGDQVAKTPNIDRFAKEGTRFTNAFSSVPS